MFVALLSALLVQVTPIQPIVKGTGLPPQEAEEAAVMAPLSAWFAGIESADAGAIGQQLRLGGGGGATVAAVGADGSRTVRHLDWQQYLAAVKPSPHRYHEGFVGQPAIEIEGDIAMVWGDFILTVDGVAKSCGVDHFDLVRENGAWKVQNVTWSQRTTGCQG